MFSIVVPVYNSVQTLSTSIQSIIDQTYKDFELIIVDDGSTDGSSELCDEFCKLDSRITTVHTKNAGVGAARNTGIVHCTKDWVIFLDSDDWFSNTYLEKLSKALIGCDSNTLVCTNHTNVYNSHSVISSKKQEVIRRGPELIQTCFDRNFFRYVTSWAKVFNRQTLKDYNIAFPIDISLYEDFCFVIQYLSQLIENNGVIHFIDAPFLFHDCRNESTLSNRKRETHEWYKIVDCLRLGIEHLLSCGNFTDDQKNEIYRNVYLSCFYAIDTVDSFESFISFRNYSKQIIADIEPLERKNRLKKYTFYNMPAWVSYICLLFKKSTN